MGPSASGGPHSRCSCSSCLPKTDGATAAELTTVRYPTAHPHRLTRGPSETRVCARAACGKRFGWALEADLSPRVAHDILPVQVVQLRPGPLSRFPWGRFIMPGLLGPDQIVVKINFTKFDKMITLLKFWHDFSYIYQILQQTKRSLFFFFDNFKTKWYGWKWHQSEQVLRAQKIFYKQYNTCHFIIALHLWVTQRRCERSKQPSTIFAFRFYRKNRPHWDF